MSRRLSVCLCILLALPIYASADTPLPLSNNQIKLLKQTLAIDDESAAIKWTGNPIEIALPVGKEKRLIFPEPIQADLSGSLTTEQLRIINNEQSLYLTAQKVFPVSRMYVTLKNSHKIILIDLVTSDTATSTTCTITLTSKKSDNSITNSVVETQQQSASNNENPSMSADIYVNAVRFAWQQLYAPERLFSNTNSFARTPMHTEPWVESLVYGDKVFAHPEISWLANGVYITAVELRNKYNHPTSINLQRDLCGDWQAASVYPRHNLKPAGDKSGDSTTLFLISSKPFGDILQVCHGRA